VKGILIKDLLSKVQLETDNPKQFNEFYFVFAAPDAY